jgi:Kef-type K+ transport system membrane component KefB
MLLASAPVAPISAHQLLVLLVQIGVLLGLALGLGRVAARLGMPAVVGELSAGMLLGPSLLVHVAPSVSAWLLPQEPTQQHMLDAVAQLGVLLLVGITGMHIDLGLVRRKGLTAAGVSAGGLLVPLALGVALGFVLPGVLIADGVARRVFALFIGVAMSVSALPVIAKTLLEMRLLHRNVGQLIVSAAAVDDIVGWFLLSVVSATAASGLRGDRIALALGSLALIVILTGLVGRPAVRATLRLTERSSEPGVSVAAAVILLMFFAAGTHALGMEPILGAFLGGILIGSSGWLRSGRLAPLRTFVMAVLAPLYFATAGLRMDLTALVRPPVLVATLAALAVAVVGKFVGAYLGARCGRLTHWEALALGAGLNARGVIGVVVAMVGLRMGVLGQESYTIVVLIAVVTSVMAPPTLRYAMRHIAETTEEHTREKVFAAT